MGYSQRILLKKFKEYIECKKKACTTDTEKANCNLPFSTLQGLCSGLVALWLYYKRTHCEQKFFNILQYISDWSKEDFKGDDPVFEAALNDIAFLHFSYKLLDEFDQSSLSQSFNVLLSDDHIQVAPSEFAITWVFDKENLSKLLEDLSHPNKMIRLSDGLHVIGIIKIGAELFFYNPEEENLPKLISNIDELINDIFTALPRGRKSDAQIALHINSFDLVGEIPSPVIDVNELYAETLSNPSTGVDLLNDPNIFHLAVRYSDRKVLDMLFDNGYEYTPWQIHNTAELNEVIENNNAKMLSYLISHNIPIDYRPPNGLTPLATAVRNHNLEALFILIKLGADINAVASDNQSLIDIAVGANNTSAIILLIACGYNLNDMEQLDIELNFGDLTPEIYNHAVELQKVLFEFTKPSQIYNVLNSLSANPVLENKKQELLEILKAIGPEISKKPISDYSAAQILEIKSVLKNLTGLAEVNQGNSEISLAAKGSKEHIEKYLLDNKVVNIDEYIKNNFPAMAQKAKSLFYLSNSDWQEVKLDVSDLKKYTTLSLNPN